MPRIHLIPGLSAILVIARHHDGEVRVLANADEPWREILNWAGRCARHERRALLAALCA